MRHRLTLVLPVGVANGQSKNLMVKDASTYLNGKPVLHKTLAEVTRHGERIETTLVREVRRAFGSVRCPRVAFPRSPTPSDGTISCLALASPYEA